MCNVEGQQFAFVAGLVWQRDAAADSVRPRTYRFISCTVVVARRPYRLLAFFRFLSPFTEILLLVLWDAGIAFNACCLSERQQPASPHIQKATGKNKILGQSRQQRRMQAPETNFRYLFSVSAVLRGVSASCGGGEAVPFGAPGGCLTPPR